MFEVAGTVQALGDNISHLRAGEKVCVLVTGGVMLSGTGRPVFYPSRRIAGNFFYRILPYMEQRFRPRPFGSGETLLIRDGGIGTTAIQLAKARP